MRTVTTTYYTLSELSDEAKSKAIENIMDTQLYRDVTGDLAHDMAREDVYYFLGLDYEDRGDIDIAIDCSFMQGSGMSFTGKLYRPDTLPDWWPSRVDHIEVGREQLWGHYVHDNLMTVAAYYEDGELADDETNQEILDYFQTVMRRIFSDLERVILDGDSYAAEELALSNDIEFLEDGSLA